MAVPSFVQASAGSFTAAGAGTDTLAGTTAGNLIIAHMMQDGTAADMTLGSSTNLERLDGTTNLMTTVGFEVIGSPSAGGDMFFAGRSTAGGSITFAFNVGVSGQDLFCRLYEFSGVHGGTTLGEVFESLYAHNLGTSASVDDGSVTTTADQRLAVQMVTVNENTTIAAFSGETGGDWSKPVAEFSSASGGGCALGIQTASMPTAGTIGGGTAALGISGGWGTYGYALIPSELSPVPTAADDPPIGFLGRGAGW